MNKYSREILIDGCVLIMAGHTMYDAVAGLLTGPIGWTLLSMLAMLAIGWETAWYFGRRFYIAAMKKSEEIERKEEEEYEFIDVDEVED